VAARGQGAPGQMTWLKVFRPIAADLASSLSAIFDSIYDVHKDVDFMTKML